MSSPELGALIAQTNARIVRTRTHTGIFVTTESGRGIVDINGARIPGAHLLGPPLRAGERVHVWVIGTTAYILGPVTPHPGIGEITGIDGDYAWVETTTGTHKLPFLTSYIPVAGDAVALAWGERPLILGALSTSPRVEPEPTPPATPGPAPQTHTFTVIDAGSYRSDSGWWQPEVWASDNNTGAWFYGTKISDTIPRNAPIHGVEINLAPLQIYGDPMNVGCHTQSTKPAGNLVITDTIPIPPVPGWMNLPARFGEFLRDNPGGIGVHHGGFHKFASLAQDAASGAVRITYG